jgi:protease-4
MSRKGWAWTIIGSLFAVLIIVLVVKADDLSTTGAEQHWEEEIVEGSGHDKIVQLFVDGVIAQEPGYFGSFSSGEFISQLHQAMLDDSVKGVVIRVNSPGGEVVASDEIHNKIKQLQEKGKPVVVSMGSVAASGGYYISAPADYIFANPATLTGSLGVIFSIPNYQDTAKWIGYKEHVIKSGPFKDIGNPLRDMSPSEQKIFKDLVDESYQRFVDVISQGRRLPRDQVLKIADGRVYSGRQAKELKLIDEFGSLEDATQYTKKKLGLEEAAIVKYVAPTDFVTAMLAGASQPNDGTLAEAIKQVVPKISQEPRLLYLFQ